MKRLAIITTHPIQYNAPWFRLLAQRGIVAVKAFYTWSQTQHEKKFDPGFGRDIEWDIPLLDGYDYTFVENVAKRPGSKSFRGIENPTLIRAVEDWNADAVLVFGWKFRSHLSAMKHFKGKLPVLFRGDSNLLDAQPFWRKLLRKIAITRALRNVDYALYVGVANKIYYLAYGIKENQLVFAPHAIDNQRFSSVQASRIPEWPHLPGDKPVFLFAGKFEEKKHPEIALSIFKSAIKNASLVMVGNGPLEQELKSRYRNIENIHFLDFQNQQLMPSIYENADVFILPSKGPGETWGLAVNEAMAAGRPVLVSDKCGCAPDLVEEGMNGYTFQSENAADLESKIRLMIERRSELHEMGRRAQQKIQDWSFEKIVTAIEGIVG